MFCGRIVIEITHEEEAFPVEQVCAPKKILHRLEDAKSFISLRQPLSLCG